MINLIASQQHYQHERGRGDKCWHAT